MTIAAVRKGVPVLTSPEDWRTKADDPAGASASAMLMLLLLIGSDELGSLVAVTATGRKLVALQQPLRPMPVHV
jgi:hypothetical protein